jgi:hypothetical protein
MIKRAILHTEKESDSIQNSHFLENAINVILLSKSLISFLSVSFSKLFDLI